MEADSSVLGGLRSRLTELEARQRAAGGATSAFWDEPPDADASGGSSGGSSGTSTGEPGWGATSGEHDRDLLTEVADLGQVQQRREVALVRALVEIEGRGVPSPGGLRRCDWLRATDPTLSGGQARALVTVATAFTHSRWQSLRDQFFSYAGDVDISTNTDAVRPVERLTVAKAAVVIDFYEQLRRVADPSELDDALDHLEGEAATSRVEVLARLARGFGEQLRPPPDAEDHARKQRESRGLWWQQPTAAGMVGLRGVLDPEGAAIVRSALEPLAAPAPLLDDEGRKIADDERPAHRRRADALIDIVMRGVSAPGDSPTTDKARVVVTVDFDTLADDLSAGGPSTGGRSSAPDEPPADEPSAAGWAPTADEPPAADEPSASGPGRGRASTRTTKGHGTCDSGDVLSPATVRRLACDAGILPVVLGRDGEPLDVGREQRLVTRSMRHLLWVRDAGCTFPGCTAPPGWTDAHHIVHWARGGPTSVANLALLCRRHHQHVHQLDLTATVTDTGVTWHTWQQWRRTAPHTSPTADDDRQESG
jgi:hypothetical protein